MTRLVPRLRRLAGALAILAALASPGAPAIAQAREPAAAVHVLRAEEARPAALEASGGELPRIDPPAPAPARPAPPRASSLFLLHRALLR